MVVSNAKSPWLSVVSGTTQGTVLRFLLFLIFINDLPSESSPVNMSLVMLLADDTKTFQEISGEAGQQIMDQEKLQRRVDPIAQWTTDWKMEINPAKSKVMHIGRQNPNLPHTINGTEITTVSTKNLDSMVHDRIPY